MPTSTPSATAVRPSQPSPAPESTPVELAPVPTFTVSVDGFCRDSGMASALRRIRANTSARTKIVFLGFPLDQLETVAHLADALKMSDRHVMVITGHAWTARMRLPRSFFSDVGALHQLNPSDSVLVMPPDRDQRRLFLGHLRAAGLKLPDALLAIMIDGNDEPNRATVWRAQRKSAELGNDIVDATNDTETVDIDE